MEATIENIDERTVLIEVKDPTQKALDIEQNQGIENALNYVCHFILKGRDKIVSMNGLLCLPHGQGALFAEPPATLVGGCKILFT